MRVKQMNFYKEIGHPETIKKNSKIKRRPPAIGVKKN